MKNQKPLSFSRFGPWIVSAQPSKAITRNFQQKKTMKNTLTSKNQTDSLSGRPRAGNHVFFSADHILTRDANRGYYWLQPKILQMLVVTRHRNQRSEYVPSRI